MKRKLFIIEDNKTEALVYRLAFGSLQTIELSVFNTGTEFYEQALQTKPDIVVLDLSLPDVDGVSLYQTIKAKYPEVPVIVISAQNNFNTVATLQEKGVQHYIVKSPTCLNYLKNVLADLLIVLDYRSNKSVTVD